MYRWTRWQPAQSRWVGRFASNRTRIDSSGVLTTRTANLATVLFWLRAGPEVTVRNRCYPNWLSNNCGKEMHVNSQNETSNTTQYQQQAFLKYVENQYSVKHRSLPIVKLQRVLSTRLYFSGIDFGCIESSCDLYDLSSKNAEYVIIKYVAKMTPTWSNRIARVLKVARLDLNLLPGLPQYWR